MHRLSGLRHLLLPALGFLHTVANESDQQSRCAADCKHRPPSVARSDGVVGNGREKDAEVVTRMHQPRAHLSALLGPFLGDERAAHCPLAADADTRQQPESGQLPDTRGHYAEKSKK